MPAADTQQRRAGLPLLPGLLWAGVGLAPVAALLVLFGGDNTSLVRVAVLLAIVAVILIGVSMALRRDPDAVRNQVEEMVFEEIDLLREDLRADITTAAKATHKALGERVVTLHESVEALRGQVDTLRVQMDRGSAPPPAQAAPAAPPPPPVSAPAVGPAHNVSVGHGVPGHGVVRHTETVKVTTRQTIVDQNDGGRGTVYGSSRTSDPVPPQRRSAAERGPEWGSAPAGQGSGRKSGEEESWTEQLLRQRLGEERFGAVGFHESGLDDDSGGFTSPAFGGSGYGDTGSVGRDPAPAGSGFNGSGYGGGGERAPSWSARGGEPWSADDRYGDAAGERRGGRRRALEPEDDDDRVTGLRAGDRWASVRSDDRGRELRVGERRTAMQADESGTEVRIEDRWAAVRREEARRAEASREPEREWEREPRRARERDADWGRDQVYWSESRWDGGDDGRRSDDRRDDRRGDDRRDDRRGDDRRGDDRRGDELGRAGGRPALPSAPSEPSASDWMQGWSARPEPVSERVARRARYEEDDDGHRYDDGPSPRSARYESGDDRWR